MKNNLFFDSVESTVPLRAGNILIAVPFLTGMYFKWTVILLIEHNKKGSFGLILNRSTTITLQDIFEQEEGQNSTIPIYRGGPVDNNLLTLHTYGDLIKGSYQVTKGGIYFGGYPSQLLLLIQNDFFDTNLIRFYLGYVGWGSGQLLSEIRKKVWVVGRFQPDLLFHDNDNQCWNKAVASLGDGFDSWTDIAKDPTCN
jgi:putative transcriptional regulator